MPRIELFLSFAEITFPVFLLIPTLVASLRILVVEPQQVARLYGVAVGEYLVVILAIGYSLFIYNAWETIAVFGVSALFISYAFILVLKWSLHEYIYAWITR